MIFKALTEGEYHAAVPEHSIEFRVARLRYERHELHGELTVSCGLAGARSFDDACISSSTMNLSSAMTRQSHGKRLADRARTAGKVDWIGLLEELCMRVLSAERAGQPAVILSQVAPATSESIVTIDGYPIYTKHHAIDFGDGGTAKSLYALYRGGKLEAQGERVALFDWELDAVTHRGRLEKMFGRERMPSIRYVRCDRPLVHEVDRLRRIIRDEEITFGIFDSVGFACDGPPEAAESALTVLQGCSSASYRRPPPGARQQGRDRGSAAVWVRLLAQLGAIHLVRQSRQQRAGEAHDRAPQSQSQPGATPAGLGVHLLVHIGLY